MAITNQERVGKAMELLRAGLAPFVERELKSDRGGAQRDHDPGAPPVPRHARLEPARVGRDASRIADEVIAHLAGQVGAEVTVTLEIEATLPDGASDQIVRAVTENSRTLKFKSHGFESE